MADVSYYFDQRSYTEYWDNADKMVDNILTNYALTTVNNQVQRLTRNTCPGTDLGTITKVEIRAYAYGDGNDELYIRPEFTGGAGDNHITVPGTSGAWGAYQDITSDTNHPDWSAWSHVQDLECDIELDDTSKGNTMYCAKVEIRVTYTPSGGYYHGLKVQGEGELALCDVGSNPLRIRKGDTTYGIELVPTDDPNASAVRIQTSSGTKAIRRYT